MATDRMREAVIETVYYETDHEWDEKARPQGNHTVKLDLWRETTSLTSNEKHYILTVDNGETISSRILDADTKAQAIREAIRAFDMMTEIPF